MVETTKRDREVHRAAAEWRLKPVPRERTKPEALGESEFNTDEMLVALCRDVDTLEAALPAVADLWPFVSHKRRCAGIAPTEVGAAAECDCGLAVAIGRGRVRQARELLREPQRPAASG